MADQWDCDYCDYYFETEQEWQFHETNLCKSKRRYDILFGFILPIALALIALTLHHFHTEVLPWPKTGTGLLS